MPLKSRASVILVHPGTQHSLHGAIGLQRAGLLQRYLTSIYSSPLIFSLLDLLPEHLAGRFRAKFFRRYSSELKSELVGCFAPPELFSQVLGRLSARLGPSFAGRIEPRLLWRNDLFGRWAAKKVRQLKPKVVIAFDTTALRPFAAAREVGALCILDQSVGHVALAAKILAEEAKRWPEVAQFFPRIPQSEIDYCLQEVQEADFILSASAYVTRSLVELGVNPEKVLFLPYGVDAQRFSPPETRSGRKGSKFRFLFVGTISQRKGILYLLEAFKGLALPDAELLLVGNSAEMADCLGRYQGYYRHIGQTTQQRVIELMQESDVFVFPSLHEGSSLAVYEALACGLPVITTENSGSVVQDGEQGFIVPIRDIEKLQERMMQLYGERELCEAMGVKARARAEEFSWDRYYARLGELLERVSGVD